MLAYCSEFEKMLICSLIDKEIDNDAEFLSKITAAQWDIVQNNEKIQ